MDDYGTHTYPSPERRAKEKEEREESRCQKYIRTFGSSPHSEQPEEKLGSKRELEKIKAKDAEVVTSGMFGCLKFPKGRESASSRKILQEIVSDEINAHITHQRKCLEALWEIVVCALDTLDSFGNGKLYKSKAAMLKTIKNKSLDDFLTLIQEMDD